MEITEVSYSWGSPLTDRQVTEYIVLHHRAGAGDVTSIHKLHRYTNLWAGIGYHYYVRKDGSVYTGRPKEKVGAHCSGHNYNSVGICFEGNFQNETMGEKQIKSGKELIAYLRGIYPGANVVRHKDLITTDCPGTNFPKELLSYSSDEASKDSTVSNLIGDGIIKRENAANWEAFLSGNALVIPDYVRSLLDRYHEKVK
ncbi:MAG: peptidoglycan recognition family protein [Bacillota bacterium]|nr:peptidoglycan recognition family protein [Bacillota bacterium]